MGGTNNSFRISLLDIGSIVTGASIAAVHVRRGVPDPVGGLAWAWAAILFAWLSLTAVGPFLYLTRRRWSADLENYPATGDRLWGLWGCPWVVAALVGSTPAPAGGPPWSNRSGVCRQPGSRLVSGRPHRGPDAGDALPLGRLSPNPPRESGQTGRNGSG